MFRDHNAFVCHNNHHWIAIRKVHGTWFNLNSKNSDGPQIISDFYLSAFISGIEHNGYEVFVVSGTLPTYDESMFAGSTRNHQKFYTLSQIKGNF